MSNLIHVAVQKKQDDGSYCSIEGFKVDWNNSDLYAWLADVRNRAAVTPIAEPRGLPLDLEPEIEKERKRQATLSIHQQDDAEDRLYREMFNSWYGNTFATSWLSIEELLAVDYDQIVEYRRCNLRDNPLRFDYGGPDTCPAGQGKLIPLKEVLGDEFMDDLQRMKEAGADRIVFCFS